MTLIDILRDRSTEHPTRLSHTFLLDGETDALHLTYADLDRRARAIAVQLQELGATGARALLLYPPGLDYVAAFFGCLYAAVTPVPIYPPDPARLNRTLDRLHLIVRDSQATIALTTTLIKSMSVFVFAQAPDLGQMHWLVTDADHPTDMADRWQAPRLTPDTLALLQYTSGSTGAPRGVMLTHAQLLHNLGLIRAGFAITSASVGMIWLPPYHDMGLIGGILQPLYSGFPVTLMSPIDFLKRPLRWLQAITRTRATVSGGPNFAYDLCLRKITPEERATLDLSSWAVAFNGAEPVRAETIDRFAAAFAPCGFRRAAFYPCYGLAEATLIVSGGQPSAPPVVFSVHADALGLRRVEPVTVNHPQARSLVGAGGPLADQQVAIVDPHSATRCAVDQVGEIWVVGPSIARGYWARPQETALSFAAYTADGAGPFLRTGDLGFMQDSELFIVGRIKDLIIIRGRNYYPEDIELTVERSHPALRPGGSAAFAIEVDGQECLVVAQEVDRRATSDHDTVVSAIRAAVAAQHELQVYSVCLLAAGGLPKTSSGKVQRHACRAAFLDGCLELLARSTLTEAAPLPPQVTATRAELLVLSPDMRRLRLHDDLREQVAAALHLDPAAVALERPLVALGIDSVGAIDLQQRLEQRFGVALSAVSLLDGLSVAHLAAHLAIGLDGAIQIDALRPPRLQPLDHVEPPPLSAAQRRLWFVEQLAPGQSAYIIPVAVRLSGQLEVAALARSLSAIVQRHAILRTTFTRRRGQPVQMIGPPLPLRLRCVDLSGLSVSARQAALTRLIGAEARRPFDLAVWPLLRAWLLRLGPDEHLLLIAIHHIVADGWSMGVLMGELAALYGASVMGQSAALPALPIQYADFAAAQQRWVQVGALEPQMAYWCRQLAGAPALLDLPADQPRPTQLALAGAHHVFQIAPDACERLEVLARGAGATLAMVMLSAFLTLLHSYTRRDDLVVGTDIASRHWAGTEHLIGMFVNQLVVRADLAGEPAFDEVLRRVRAVVLDAYRHPDVPFDTLVEALRPPRDPAHNPLFQVMFVFENAPLPPLELPGLTLELLDVDSGGAPFDLSLLLTRHAGGLKADLRYRTDLFTAGAIAHMAADLALLIDAVVERSSITLPQIHQLLAEAEQQRQRDLAAAQTAKLRAARTQKFSQVRRRS